MFDYKKEIKKTIKLLKNEQFDKALFLIDEMLKKYNSLPRLHVLRGISIQFSENTEYELKESLQSFLRALDLDENYTNALIETGKYEYAIEDDSNRAVGYFDKAIEILLKQLEEAISGKIKCLAEIKSKEDAKNYMAEISKFLENSTHLKDVYEDL